MSKVKNSITLTERQLYDLELIANGGFAPLSGFLNKDDYENVVSDSRLKNGELWPIPVVLDVDSEIFASKVGDIIDLKNSRGKKLATLTIESIFVPDKKVEAKNVYGTTDISHFGVDYLFNRTKDTYVGGKITVTEKPEHADFAHIRKSPAELKKIFVEKGLKSVIAFQTRNPIHRAHFEVITRSAKKHNAHILIHPAVGPTKDGDIDYPTRVRSYEKLVAQRLPDATLSLLPIAMRMAGPREALWHAIIRKNYGATHFIIGRDHASPGKDLAGKAFYGLTEAQEFAIQYAREIGIEIVTSPELVYDESQNEYISPEDAKAVSKIVSISGTEFRRRLREGEEIPGWFSFPEVIEELSKNKIN